jgi:hypothetical protein
MALILFLIRSIFCARGSATQAPWPQEVIVTTNTDKAGNIYQPINPGPVIHGSQVKLSGGATGTMNSGTVVKNTK